MTADEAVSRYTSMGTDVQVRFLARFAFELTILARGTYVAGTDEVAEPVRLRVLNEVQHRVVGQLCKLLEGDSARYADEDIARILIADDEQLLRVFVRAARVRG
jgi:hypothetical protein